MSGVMRRGSSGFTGPVPLFHFQQNKKNMDPVATNGLKIPVF
jgi:hypothetical protein